MAALKNGTDEEMDLMSVSDNLEITREEEKSLLGETDSMMGSPIKSSPKNRTSLPRKLIVYDLDESTADDDNDRDDQMRDKFRTERKTISFSETLNKRRDIPDDLSAIGRELMKGLKNKYENKNQRKRLNGHPNRFGNGSRNRQQFSQQRVQSNRFNQNRDLRQFIADVKNNRQNQRTIGSVLQNQGLQLNPIVNYQLGLGIIDPIDAQNQMLISTLLAQNGANPLLNRLAIGGQTIVPDVSVQKPKQNIAVTVFNDIKERNSSSNSNITQIRPQIRCRITTDMDVSDSATDTTDCEIIENIPTMPAPTQPKKKLSTLFSKHLANKVNAAKNPTASTSKVESFGEVLAEVAVGVDNDYLRRMEEMEKKRKETLELKARRRQEMSGERLESALKLKEQIERQRHY